MDTYLSPNFVPVGSEVTKVSCAYKQLYASSIVGAVTLYVGWQKVQCDALNVGCGEKVLTDAFQAIEIW